MITRLRRRCCRDGYNRLYVAFIVTAVLLLTSCKEDGPAPAPVIHATVSPAAGNTTQTFKFDLNQSESRTGRGTKVFSRWGWDGDGIWDTPFTRMLVYEHRYYKPGTWKPRIEMSNMEGTTDTLSFTIPVTRGYSAPKPILVSNPPKGHIFTRFLLDASGTRDDEDSLNQLTFRWDFEGDGIWDTGFGDSVTIYHQFPAVGLYFPSLQARDQSGLISRGQTEVLVNTEDPNLVVNFRCIPDSVTNDTPILMDASVSADPENPDKPLMYRWDWNNDQTWDTGWLTSPLTQHIFTEEYIHFVRLAVKSYRGLTKEVAIRIRVYHKNTPPVAHFSMSSLAGNTSTDFRIDAWSTYDFESAPSQLFFLWDYNGDGQWDTEPSHNPAFSYRYATPGIYNTTVSVTDSLGASDTYSKVISISKGTNQTGIYLDHRGVSYEYYGTVLIGDQWWFARSLSVRDQSLLVGRKYFESYYKGDMSPTYRDYGCHYKYDQLPIACPDGWRVPSKDDWDKLFANYPKEELYEALMPGGISDFSASLGGKAYGLSPFVTECPGFGETGNYWSTTTQGEASGVSIWLITFDKNQKKVLKGFSDKDKMRYSVRCVKDK